MLYDVGYNATYDLGLRQWRSRYLVGRSNNRDTLGEGSSQVEGAMIVTARRSGNDRALATNIGRSAGLSSVPEPRARNLTGDGGHVPS